MWGLFVDVIPVIRGMSVLNSLWWFKPNYVNDEFQPDGILINSKKNMINLAIYKMDDTN